MKLLILFPKYYYERKMSSVRAQVASYLATRHGAHLSGVGWRDYDERQSLQENIRRICPHADAILWYKPDGNTKERVPAIIAPRRREIPAVCIYNEAWWPDQRAWKECKQVGTDLVVYHHMNDSGQFGDLPRVHVPHCAPSRLADYARPFADREIDVLVTGAMSERIYPVRTRIARLIQTSQISGRVRRHPGYRLADLAACYSQYEDYGRELGNAKVVVCCGSRYLYGLAKYAEAAMAGAAIVGELTPDFESTLNPHIHAVHNTMSDERLVGIIREAIGDRHSGTHLQAAALQHHALASYCDRVAGLIGGFAIGRASRSA